MELFTEKETYSRDPRKNKLLQDLVIESMEKFELEYLKGDSIFEHIADYEIKDLIEQIHLFRKPRTQDSKSLFDYQKNIKIFNSDEEFAGYVENLEVEKQLIYRSIYSGSIFLDVSLRYNELINILSSDNEGNESYVTRIVNIINDQIGDLSLDEDEYFIHCNYNNPIGLFLERLLRFNTLLNCQLRKVNLYDEVENIPFIEFEFLKDISAFWLFRSLDVMGVIFPHKINTLIDNMIELYRVSSKVIVVNDIYHVIRKPKIRYKRDPGNRPYLHSEEVPAMEYPDGTYYFYRNGIFYPGWIFTKEKSQFKIEKILDLPNSHIRQEAINQYGTTEFFNSLENTLLDSQNGYELLLVKVGRRKCEFLKMMNPSTGEIHFEGIEPGIKTVKDALKWRFNIEVFHEPNFNT